MCRNWPRFKRTIEVVLADVAETLPDRIERAQKQETTQQGVKRAALPSSIFFADSMKMIDVTKPDIVWAFLETSRHLEVIQYCAPRGVNVMFEYPGGNVSRRIADFRNSRANITRRSSRILRTGVGRRPLTLPRPRPTLA